MGTKCLKASLICRNGALRLNLWGHSSKSLEPIFRLTDLPGTTVVPLEAPPLVTEARPVLSEYLTFPLQGSLATRRNAARPLPSRLLSSYEEKSQGGLQLGLPNQADFPTKRASDMALTDTRLYAASPSSCAHHQRSSCAHHHATPTAINSICARISLLIQVVVCEK